MNPTPTSPPSTSHRILLWLVIGMGVLIVVGVGVLVAELGKRMLRGPASAPSAAAEAPLRAAPLPGFGQAQVEIPEGSQVLTLSAAGDRILAHVHHVDGSSSAYLIDPRTGALVGVVQFVEKK
jgi:hypothetical protein